MDFNLQTFLSEMRAETRDDLEKLSKKVDSGFDGLTTKMSNHERDDQTMFNALDKRIVAVENTRRTIRWLGATVIAALLAGSVDLLFSHIPSWFKHP